MLQERRGHDDQWDAQSSKRQLQDSTNLPQVEGAVDRPEGVPLHGDEIGVKYFGVHRDLVLQAVQSRGPSQFHLPDEHSTQAAIFVDTKSHIFQRLVDPDGGKFRLVLHSFLDYHNVENSRLFALFAQGKTMANVQIVLHQVRESDPSGYMIHNTIVTSATPPLPVTLGISPDLFVYSYVDGTNDTYQHVATPQDVDELPERNQSGWNIYGQLFRQSTADLKYSNLTAAEEQASMIKFRLEQLAIDYDVERETYEVTTDYIYKSLDEEIVITLRQVGSMVSAESYRNVSTHHVAPVEIEPYVFVFRFVNGTTDTYTRIATVDDMLTLPYRGESGKWPVDPQEYYRDQSANVQDPTLAGIVYLATTIRQGLAKLVQEYREYDDVYSGDETVVYNA